MTSVLRANREKLVTQVRQEKWDLLVEKGIADVGDLKVIEENWELLVVKVK